MTATSDLIRLIRLEVAVYHNAKVCGNWHIDAHAPGQTCFHVVTQGSCKLEVPGHLSTTLAYGDLLLFPRELAHSMEPGLPPCGEEQQRHLPYEQAGDLEGTGLLCAEVTFKHQASEYFLDALPPVLLIRNDGESPWLRPLVEMILAESQGNQPVSDVILDRLCELLFTYALSHYLTRFPQHPGLLALFAHPRLSSALAAIHRSPEEHWTLDKMARQAAQSRTLFARTFKQLSGWTPMQYLNWWRMQLAWDYLDSGMAVSNVAEKTGYRSQAGFCRAFKQRFSIHAGKVRRHDFLPSPSETVGA